MIQFAIALINIILLLNGVAAIINYLLPTISKPLQLFATIILSVTVLSFIYFVGLILKQEFNILLILFTVINLLHLYWTYPWLLKRFNLKNLTVHDTYDIVPIAAVLLMTVFFVFHGSKYGDFDAWALWNTHAKFLYHPTTWTRMFEDPTIMSHADYPLMLPSLVAFFWKMVNNTSFIVPILLSFSIIATIPLLLYYALKAEFKNRFYAYFGLLMLVADYHFQLLNSAQCADTLLSLFILSAFIIHHYLKQSNFTNAAYVLGFICASCTWIKNEGELFFVVFTVIFFISNYKNTPYIKKYLAGSILPIIVIISFKEFFSPVNDLIATNNNRIPKLIHDIKDGSRYITIVKMYATTLIDNFWMAVILFLYMMLVNRGFFKSFAPVIFYLMFLGFTIIYLTTPYDLSWHIYTSFYRLLYQVYPSLIYTAIISVGYIHLETSACLTLETATITE